MAREFHDINEPGYFFGKGKGQPEDKKPVTGVDDSGIQQEEKPEPEVRLISAEWKPGPDGFTHNKHCFLDIQTEFLPGKEKTIRLRVRGKLFCIRNGVEHDLSEEFEGFISRKTGVARLEVRNLWFIDDDHYNAWLDDPNTPCTYKVKNIFHSRGQNAIDSPELEMPASKKHAVDFVEIPDITFNTGSAVPCLDEDGVLVSAVSAAYRFAEEHPDKEIVIFGHTDTDGKTGFNHTLSRSRAMAVKSLFDDDVDRWKETAAQYGKVEDIQATLSSLTESFGWDCDAGPIDNADGPKTREGVKGFQAGFNERFDQAITVDGIIGPQTWGAVHTVYRDLIKKRYAEDGEASLPDLAYGHNGTGYYACGESFPIEGKGRDEYTSQANRRVEIAFVDGASPPVLQEPSDTEKPVELEACPVFDDSKSDWTAIEVSDGSVAVDGEVFYDTGADEIGLIKPSRMQEVKREIEWMDAFTPYMKVFLESEEGREEKDRSAEARAVLQVMKEFVDAESNQEAQSIVDNLDSRIKQVKKDILDDEESYNRTTAAGHKMKAGDIREVFRVAGKRMVRVRGKKIRSHNRWLSREQVLAQLKKEQRETRDENKKKKGPAREGELKLLEKKLFSADGSWSPEIEDFNSRCNINFFEESEILSGDIGAQFLRHSAEATAQAAVNWKEERSVKIGAKAAGSFALAQAQGKMDVNLPSENGFNLIAFLRRIDPKIVDENCTEIFLLLQLSTTGSAFVGVCAAVSMDLGVSVREKDQSGGLETGLELFAGAKTAADSTLAMKMKLLREDDEEAGSTEWAGLGEVSYGVWAGIGIGLEAGFQLGYFEERFRFQSKIGLVLKAGGGTYVKGSLHAVNGARLIWTIARAMNWQHMSHVLDRNVHEAYQGMMYCCFAVGESFAEAYEEFSTAMDEIMHDVSSAAERGLGGLKAVDDTFDELIPGYSGFKHFNANFLLLKSTYYFLKQRNENYDLKSAAIAAVETAEAKGRWKYATWQVKVNLIYDMRFGGAGIGGFTEERKEDAVIAVLRSARHAGEFAKIVNQLRRPPPGKNRKEVNIDDLLDFKQQKAFDSLKKKYRYTEF